MNIIPIENVSTVKYLGVHFSSDLKRNNHIDAIVSKSSKALGFIRRHLHQAHPAAKFLAYTTLVRSEIEYASLIWNPHQLYLIHKLEAIQNKAARFITKNYSRQSSITAIKASLKLPSLEKRRILALLSHIHRLYHSHSSFASYYIRPTHRIFPRLDHALKIELMIARTHLFSHSPLFLAVHHWNKLPSDIVFTLNHDAFVQKLKGFLQINFD
ncbi:uncharacterized protein LOC144116455 [Amblyomma americanum]